MALYMGSASWCFYSTGGVLEDQRNVVSILGNDKGFMATVRGVHCQCMNLLISLHCDAIRPQKGHTQVPMNEPTKPPSMQVQCSEAFTAVFTPFAKTVARYCLGTCSTMHKSTHKLRYIRQKCFEQRANNKSKNGIHKVRISPTCMW